MVAYHFKGGNIMKKILGVLGSLVDGVVKVERYEMEYESFRSLYSVLNCETFTIASRSISSNYYDIYCDDEGLLKDNHISAVLTPKSPGEIEEVLAGNIFICNHTEDGDIASLNEEQVSDILSSTLKKVDGNEFIIYNY
jgi:hypothetical protein